MSTKEGTKTHQWH